MKQPAFPNHPQAAAPAEAAAVRFVRGMGARPTLSGYRFLIKAIELALRNPMLSGSMMHGLYPAVADCFRVSASSVEHNIRKVIEDAYYNDPQRLQSMFYYRCSKPSISEVIAMALESEQQPLKY